MEKVRHSCVRTSAQVCPLDDLDPQDVSRICSDDQYLARFYRQVQASLTKNGPDQTVLAFDLVIKSLKWRQEQSIRCKQKKMTNDD